MKTKSLNAPEREVGHRSEENPPLMRVSTSLLMAEQLHRLYLCLSTSSVGLKSFVAAVKFLFPFFSPDRSAAPGSNQLS
jgi:hypothetical protein